MLGLTVDSSDVYSRILNLKVDTGFVLGAYSRCSHLEIQSLFLRALVCGSVGF